MDADLISKLPDHVIHHILSFLPTIDSVRTSLLSRRWRQMWYLVPTLELCDDGIESEFFYNFVEQLLEQHKMGMHRFTNSVLTRLKHDMYYHGCQSQVVGCPSLKKLWIVDCSTLNNLQLSSSSLKLQDIYGEWDTIKIDAVNLRSFFYGGGQCTCHFDFTSCKKIKYLSLAGACFHPDNDFASLISGLPVLESLALSESEVIDIRNEHLKMLYYDYVQGYGDRNEILIVAPNLVSFSYSCDDKLIKFLTNSPNLLETELAF